MKGCGYNHLSSLLRIGHRKKIPGCVSYFSTSESPRRPKRLIPTQHSSRAVPPICRDSNELKDLTQQLLETPIGSLFCQNITTTKFVPTRNIDDDRDDAYAIARESGELVEYLLRGYNQSISPWSLWSIGTGKDRNVDSNGESSILLETMIDVMDRFHKEGAMYHRMRRETLDHYNSTPNNGNQQESEKPNNGDDDFAIPGVTTNMYDTILDSMACATQLLLDETQNGSTAANSSSRKSNSNKTYLHLLEPNDVYRVAGAAWKAHDLNNLHINKNVDGSSDQYYFPRTVPTMVTYNATLRGIGNLCLAATADEEKKDEERRGMFVDEGLAYGFGVYNHLTHNNHGLPKRNAASVIYLLQIIKSCIPPSRTRGNMTVALWHQASMEGIVTPALIQSINELHLGNCNGPEFDVFLRSLDECTSSDQLKKNSTITPQRFARFAKKYSHSKFY